jgi:hypothetical protein
MTTPDIAGLCERLRRSGRNTCGMETNNPVNPDGPKAADTLERQAAEIKRLQNLLNGRDDFIVGEGLWPKFCDGLPPRAALTGEDLGNARAG